MKPIVETKSTAENQPMFDSEHLKDLLSLSRMSSAQLIQNYIHPEAALTVPAQLLTLLKMSPWNPLFLAESLSFDLLCSLIEVILCLSKEDPKGCRQLWTELFNLLLEVSGLSRCHFEAVYKTLAATITDLREPKDYSQCYTQLMCALQLLQLMLNSRQKSAKAPASYFYMLDSNSRLCAAIPHKTPWPFANGFTVVMWIKVDKALTQSLPVLVRARGSDKGFECYFKGNVLNYRTLPAKYIQPSNFFITLSIG